ncbi:MAG: aminoglycoside phosphotransferase family protein [Pikeienuella sp.]
MRDDMKREFLSTAGWGDAVVSSLAGDASNRRYDRVAGPRGNAVLMDAPAERGEDISVFLDFTALLRGMGLSAPKVLAADRGAGFALLEDLGDDLYARVAAQTPELETTIYAAAVDVLVEMHAAQPPTHAGTRLIAPYDAAVLMREAELATEWWVPAASAAPLGDAQLTAYTDLIKQTCAEVSGQRDALVLRDYHAENLLWLPDRDGIAKVGQLDYQDALIGSRAYDLVSLLEDARRDTTADLREAMLTRYVAASGVDEAQFRSDYAALGAQRNLKIVGIFARLWLRDGKAGYLDLIPRVWGHLVNDLGHPDLAPLAAFVHAYIPAPTPEALANVRAARAL